MFRITEQCLNSKEEAFNQFLIMILVSFPKEVCLRIVGYTIYTLLLKGTHSFLVSQILE